MREGSRTIERRIDAGGRHFFLNEWQGEEPREGVVLDMTGCVNPDCPSQEVILRGRILQLTEAGEWVRSEGPDLRVALDLASKMLTIPEGSEADAIPEWVGRGMTVEWLEGPS